MVYNNLKKIEKAPPKGTYLIYTRREVLFGSYDSLEQVKELLGETEVLEMHLFDKDKEYRTIKSTGKRFAGNGGMIETLVEDSWDVDETYVDCVQLIEEYSSLGERISVINHLRYDENGMISIDNYRLTL